MLCCVVRSTGVVGQGEEPGDRSVEPVTVDAAADAGDPVHATTAALAALAHRVQALTAEITTADKRLRPIVARTAPRLSALSGVGPEVAGQLLATAGDNPDRLRSETALAFYQQIPTTGRPTGKVVATALHYATIGLRNTEAPL